MSQIELIALLKELIVALTLQLALMGAGTATSTPDAILEPMESTPSEESVPENVAVTSLDDVSLGLTDETREQDLEKLYQHFLARAKAGEISIWNEEILRKKASSTLEMKLKVK